MEEKKERSQEALRVLPYCQHMRAYNRLLSTPLQLCRLKYGAKRGGLKWVTDLVPRLSLGQGKGD